LNLFPALGGKQQTHQYSLQLGYTLGVNKLTNNFSFTFTGPITNYATTSPTPMTSRRLSG